MISTLRKRGLYDPTVWQYGFKHEDQQAMVEYIKETNFGFKQPYMKTSLVSFNKVQLHEYDPLVNQRAHLMKGDNSNILNVTFRKEYENFIDYLLWKP